jgi:SAM-dependent methyltransferase
MAITKEDTYPVLRTEKESARLFTQLHLIAAALGGHVLAPLDLTQPNLRILDVGTGTGRWLSLVKEQIPEEVRDTATLMGTDIAPYPDSSIDVQMHNFKNPFPAEWEGSFDLVQMRSCLMMSPGNEAAELVGRLVKLVKKGGWLQLVDTSCDPGPVLESDLPHTKLFKFMGKCVLDMGMDPVQGGKVAELLLQNKDLVEVGNKASPMRVGKGGSPDLERQSMEYLDFMFGNVEHAAEMLKLDDIATLKSAVRDEAERDGFDFTMYGAWGKRA